MAEVHDKEWQGMPEFVQESQKPYQTLTIRFDSEEAVQEFSELIGQKLTNNTKSIWHPKLIRGQHSHKRYTTDKQIEDESIK